METRLQKYLADSGICSRRHAELLIAEKKVTINGRVAVIGDKVTDGDEVLLEGRRILPRRQEFTYLMLYKPRGVITTLSDEEGRKCLTSLLGDVKARVVPVGRLDRNSEGLLLLTDDGALVNHLTHPRSHVEKQYLATIKGLAGGDVLERLRAPMELDGVPLQPVQIEVLRKSPDRSVLRFTLTEGRNRQIRRMCEIAQVDVLRLKRVSMGAVQLGQLAPGTYRPLTRGEVFSLQPKPPKPERSQP